MKKKQLYESPVVEPLVIQAESSVCVYSGEGPIDDVTYDDDPLLFDVFSGGLL